MQKARREEKEEEQADKKERRKKDTASAVMSKLPKTPRYAAGKQCLAAVKKSLQRPYAHNVCPSYFCPTSIYVAARPGRHGPLTCPFVSCPLPCFPFISELNIFWYTPFT